MVKDSPCFGPAVRITTLPIAKRGSGCCGALGVGVGAAGCSSSAQAAGATGPWQSRWLIALPRPTDHWRQSVSSSDSASGCSQTSMRLALGPSLRAKSPSGPRCELVCFMVVMGGMVAGVEVIDPQWSDQAVSVHYTACTGSPSPLGGKQGCFGRCRNNSSPTHSGRLSSAPTN